MKTTHKHVYVGLAIPDENVRQTREWVSGLNAPQYARLIELLSRTTSNHEHDRVLNELGAPIGDARSYLHVMPLRGTSVNPCPRCP